ncbi:MAG: hypothetical protein H2045_13055 [Rhizobiales bacterium]|nr:hypothetical protein [Hyphomicrobiales bacterium]
MATNSERGTKRRFGQAFSYPLKAGAKINKGAVVALQNGLAIAGIAAANLTVVGVAAFTADNSAGGDAATAVNVLRDTFFLENAAGADGITAADIGRDCFLVDDETVAKTNAANTRSRAGRIDHVEPGGVWVFINGAR